LHGQVSCACQTKPHGQVRPVALEEVSRLFKHCSGGSDGGGEELM